MREWYAGGQAEILLVDDSPATIRLMADLFREVDPYARISTARDGMEALAFLKREGAWASAPRPDLILLDLGLPKLNGHEVLAEIKADPELRPIPVLILSGSWYEPDVERSYELGATCFIKVPLELDDFVATIREIVRFWMEVAVLPSRVTAA